MSGPARAPSRLLLIATVLLVAGNLRPAITVVGPLVERIGVETGLSPSALGLLGALPVLSLGVFSPLVHHMSSRWGMERSVLIALLVLAGGTVLRSIPGGPMPAGIWTLLLGTIIIGAAIAVGNVLVPAIVKRDFPDRVPLMTGLYTATLVGCAALASGLAVPMAEGLGWELALASVAVLALGTAAIWMRRRDPTTTSVLLAAQEGSLPAPQGGPDRTALWRSAVAWQVTAYFGLQSAVFFVMLTWLPSIQTYHGISHTAAGWWLAIYQAVGIVASLLVGPLMQRMADQRGVAVGLAAMMALGLAGIALVPELMPVWCLISGFSSGGTLLVALTLVSLRARTPHQAGRLSGMAQGVGYLVAGTGPLVVGAMVDMLGSWTPALLLMLAVVTAQGLAGWFAGRNVLVGAGGD